MKAIQYFTEDYLEQSKKLSADQIAQFLDDFRLLHGIQHKPKTKLISIKIETDLLNAFKTQATLDGVPYQTKIKRIMRRSLTKK